MADSCMTGVGAVGRVGLGNPQMMTSSKVIDQWPNDGLCDTAGTGIGFSWSWIESDFNC